MREKKKKKTRQRKNKQIIKYRNRFFSLLRKNHRRITRIKRNLIHAIHLEILLTNRSNPVFEHSGDIHAVVVFQHLQLVLLAVEVKTQPRVLLLHFGDHLLQHLVLGTECAICRIDSCGTNNENDVDVIQLLQIIIINLK